jgi:ribosomal protein S18 acetylase RimI-like enzyme
MTLTRRPATPADTDFARIVHHQAYRGVVVRQFGTWDESRQDEFFAADWSVGGFEILLCDGEPCGYVAVDDRTDAIGVRELVLLPGFQGRGIGTRMLTDVIGRARSRGVPVRLGALHENRALVLYRRLGFRDAGATATHTLLAWTPPGVVH